MAFQFKPRSKETAHEECEKQLTLLRDYNRALQKENESRNEERKALQAEIERLLRHEREWKDKSTVVTSQVISSSISTESREYIQLKEQYAQLKSKYEGLLLENSSLTSKIITSEYSTTRITAFESERTKLTETIRNHQSKIITLETKISTYERELSEARSKHSMLERKISTYQRELAESRNRQESASSTITRQYQESISTIDDLEKQLRAKTEQILRLEMELSAKDEQTKTLQRNVDGYSIKIDALSEELARLQRIHKVETVRIVQRQDPSLRIKLDQLANLNAALTADNMTLRSQAEYMRELERRSSLLEETNRQLQIELRTAIEARGTASRVQLEQDRNLKELVYTLKAELQEVRSFNQMVRQENDDLYAQLQKLKSSSPNGHSRCHRCKHHHRSRSRSPVPHQERIVVHTTLGDTYPVFQSNLTQPSRNQTSHLNIGNSQSRSHFHTFQEGKSRTTSSQPIAPSPIPTQAVNERYNDLQRKIQLLQSENQVLKKKLVHEI